MNQGVGQTPRAWQVSLLRGCGVEDAPRWGRYVLYTSGLHGTVGETLGMPLNLCINEAVLSRGGGRGGLVGG